MTKIEMLEKIINLLEEYPSKTIHFGGGYLSHSTPKTIIGNNELKKYFINYKKRISEREVIK